MLKLRRAYHSQLPLLLKRGPQHYGQARPIIFPRMTLFSTQSVVMESSPPATLSPTDTIVSSTSALQEYRQLLTKTATTIGTDTASKVTNANGASLSTKDIHRNMVHQLWHQYEKVQGDGMLTREDYTALRSQLWKSKLWGSEDRILQVLSDMKQGGHEWSILEYNEYFLVNLYQARYQDILTAYNGPFTASKLKHSIGSFNAILATYIKLGQEDEAGRLIKEARKRWGLLPDIRDFSRSMHRSMPKDAEVVAKGRELIAQYAFEDVEVVNSNLQHLFRDKLVDDGIWVYEAVSQKKLPLELVTCTLLIKNLVDAQKMRLADAIYNDMTRRGLKPNPTICGAMLTLYAHRRQPDEAEQVVRNMMMAGHPINEHIYNQLIKVYFRARLTRKAILAFEEIQRHPQLQLNEVILNTMVDGLVINREIQAASVLYRQMLTKSETKIKADMVTFNTLFKGFVQAKEYTLAASVVQDMYCHGCEPDTVTYTTLINSIFEYKQPKTTRELMDYVKGVGMTPNIYTFNAMINGWVQHRNMNEAEATMALLQSPPYKLSPTIHTITSLLQGYVDTMNLPKAMQTFQFSIARGITPDRAAYNLLITGFLDHDRFDDALTCLQHMRTAKVNPTKDTWHLLMEECVRKQLWKNGSMLVSEIEKSGFKITNASLRRNYLILKKQSN